MPKCTDRTKFTYKAISMTQHSSVHMSASVCLGFCWNNLPVQKASKGTNRDWSKHCINNMGIVL